MISVSNNFKTEITKPRTIDGKVIVGNRTLTSSQVNYIRRVFNTSLFKTILKQVEIDSNEPIDKGETVNPQFGLLINNSFEYVSLGSYKAINEPILNKDTNSYQISSCDKIVESMVPYGLTTSDITYPCTVRQLFVAIFTKLGWSTSGIPNTFTNSTSIIEEDVYSNVNMTYRDVLDELCTISCMFLVDKGNPTLIQKTTTNETINEQFMKSTNVAVKEKVFFNSLVFSRAEESDNIYRKDDTSIATNGLHEFKVSDLQILSLNWRDNFIEAMWNYIKTFEYYSYEIDTYGIIYLEPVDLFTISTFGDTYNTILLNSDLTIGNGVSEKIYADTPKETTTEYQYATDTDRKLNQTYLIVDKQQGQINAVVSQVDEIEQDLSNPTNTLTGQYFDLEDALDEPLVDFKMYGDTQQDSTTGKQLIDINSSSFDTQTINGVTITNNGDGSFKLNGTVTGDNFSMRVSSATPSIINSGTRYYLKKNTLSGSYSGGSFVLLVYANLDGGNQTALIILGEPEQGSFISNNSYNAIWLWLYASIGRTFNNLIIKPIISTFEDTNWEKYTGNAPSPSPSYPQLIHIVSGDNEIKVCNKNLANEELEQGAYSISDGYSLVSSSKYVRTKNFILLQPNTTYTINFNNRVDSKKGNYLFYGKTKNFLNSSNLANNYTFTTSNDTHYLRIDIYSNVGFTPSDITNLQLEKGSTSSTYEAYTGQSQLISLGDIELNKISTYQDYIYKDNDKWFLHKEIGKVVLNGSENIANNQDYISIGRFNITSITNTKGGSAGNPNAISTHFLSKYETANGNIYVGYNGNICLIDTDYSNNLAGFKTWLGTNKPIVYYVLATPTDTEITGTLLEQLNNLMTLPLYKNLTHITLTPNDLQPTMKIEYYRDTSINENFVRQPQLENYYTKSETTAQIQIGNASIQQSVVEVQTTLNNNNEAINTISNQVQNIQTSTSQQINIINEQLENGVEKVKTRTGFTFDDNGLSITKGEQFKNLNTDRNVQIISNGKEISFMGYDDNLKKTVARVPELESERATIGVHRTEVITRNGKKRTAGFYIGGGN